LHIRTEPEVETKDAAEASKAAAVEQQYSRNWVKNEKCGRKTTTGQEMLRCEEHFLEKSGVR